MVETPPSMISKTTIGMTLECLPDVGIYKETQDIKKLVRSVIYKFQGFLMSRTEIGILEGSDQREDFMKIWYALC